MLTRPITRGITRPITRPLVRQSSVFDPLTLWAQGQQGAFYAPWDLSTLFQDSAGTTPVTADGDPVGLMLDKRLGLVRGPELVENGDFSNGLEGWTNLRPEDVTLEVVGGRMVLSNYSGDSNGDQSGCQTIATTAGTTYYAEAHVEALDQNCRFRCGSTINVVRPEDGVKLCSIVFTATGSSTNICLDLADSSRWRSGSAAMDNVTVRKLPGNHAVQDTTAAKPTYRTDGTLHWLEFDGDDDQLVATIPGITNATVAIAKSTGTEITYPVDLSGGEFVMDETNYGVIVREGEFTEQEALDVTTYLNTKAGVEL